MSRFWPLRLSVPSLLAVTAIGVATVSAAAPKAAETRLTAAGQKFEAQCADLLNNLQADITKALPSVPEQKRAALQQARDAVKAAEAQANAAQQSLSKIQGARGLATVQEGQKFQLAANDDKAPVEIAVPYTIGKWQQTQPVEISLVNGKNVFHFTLTGGSRGVTIKEFTLTPVKQSGK
jgi:hypothetical protein